MPCEFGRGPGIEAISDSYTFEPSAAGNSTTASGGPYYTCTIELQAGKAAVLFEQESNVEIGHGLRLEAIKPARARYRGHSSSSIAQGREPNGRQYRPWHDRGPQVAFVDLDPLAASGQPVVR